MLSDLDRRIFKAMEQLEDVDDSILFGSEEYSVDELLLLEDSIEMDLEILFTIRLSLNHPVSFAS